MTNIQRVKDAFHRFQQWWGRHPQLTALVVGQVLSLLITGTGVCSQLLATKYDVNMPTTQSLFNYVLLAVVYGVVYWRKVPILEVLKQRWFIYLPLAFVDVEANYFVVKAYQYTSITSVMLLDCFTIPCVMVFTFFILKTKYNWRHLVGVVACLGGLGILVWSDAASNNESSASGPSPLFGDILCLVGSLLYAVSNTGQEVSVKKWDRSEFLAMIGLFGAPISLLQLVILERHEVESIGWNFPVIALILGFALFLFAMYSLTPHMMVLSGSTLFNLSLLTSDAYAILFGLFLFQKHLHWAYWIALVIIIFGLCIYNIMNEPASSHLDHPQSDSSSLSPSDTPSTSSPLDDDPESNIAGLSTLHDDDTTSGSNVSFRLAPSNRGSEPLDLPDLDSISPISYDQPVSLDKSSDQARPRHRVNDDPADFLLFSQPHTSSTSVQ